jgi:hypothetical protein
MDGVFSDLSPIPPAKFAAKSIFPDREPDVPQLNNKNHGTTNQRQKVWAVAIFKNVSFSI